jgi:polysaccharide pyruvyl transferase WcaK-like protein
MAGSGKFALIVGGELRNKGAQAMSFITICEIKQRFPELVPVLVSEVDAPPTLIQKMKGQSERPNYSNLNFLLAHQLIEGRTGWKGKLKILLSKKENEIAKSYFDNAALCVDISGYAFGDKWGVIGCTQYLDRVETLVKRGIPTYLLPQSFGPFDFNGEDIKCFAARADKLLSKAKIIFSREEEGFKSMIELCPDANVVLARDIVLQNRKLDFGLIFKNEPTRITRTPDARYKYVGIVPNARIYEHYDRRSLDTLYTDLIEKLLTKGYRIAIVRHATEDLAICKKLKDFYVDDPRVELFQEDRYCFEYRDIFINCDFLIASRFHSIVHAYKSGVPCIALGWSIKYYELLKLANQEDLVFDVTSSSFDGNNLLNSIDYVIENMSELSNEVNNAVQEARENDVFDIVEKDYDAFKSGCC